MRHNRRVMRRALRGWWWCLLAVAACGRTPEPPARALASMDRVDAAQPSLAWRGLLACADCDGIDTDLRLVQGGGAAARYELVETFLVEGGTQRFREQGRWERSDDLVRLRDDRGGERLYRLQANGALVATSLDGREAGGARRLAPAVVR
jgi:uncharacterized lipoprotein NlpE involved in copper resistance